MNISNFLKDAIESNDHDNLALLWIDINKTNIKCVDCEKFHFINLIIQHYFLRVFKLTHLLK